MRETTKYRREHMNLLCLGEKIQQKSNMYFDAVILDYRGNRYQVVSTLGRRIRPDVVLPESGNIEQFIEYQYLLYETEKDPFLEILREEEKVTKVVDGRNEYLYEAEAKSKRVKNLRIRHKIVSIEREWSREGCFMIMDVITMGKSQASVFQSMDCCRLGENCKKQELLSHLLHEIRTPLNGIINVIQMMKEGKDLRNNEYLDKAIALSNHLNSLLSSVLDMAKLEYGKLELRKEWITEKEFFGYINTIIEPMVREKKIQYTCNYQKRYQYIYVDKGRLQQIMVNLLVNAIKYNHIGGMVTFSIETEKLQEDYERVSFCIEDNGKGMSREFLKKAFTPFEQEEPLLGERGVGLGLAITKRLVTLMDGTLTIKSKINVGTTVTVAIDIQGSNKKEVTESSQNRERYQQDKRRNSKKYCLLVEDNELSVEIVSSYLQEMGLGVDSTMDGVTALEKFRQSEEGYYSIILIDVMLPKMDGLEVVRQVRRSRRRDAQTVPVVAMTANSFSEDIERSYESGVNHHLVKPFGKRQLQELVASELQ